MRASGLLEEVRVEDPPESEGGVTRFKITLYVRPFVYPSVLMSVHYDDEATHPTYGPTAFWFQRSSPVKRLPVQMRFL